MTKEDIMRVASGIFTDDNVNMAVIGPVRDEKAIREAMHIP